jgi:CRISPR-associated protein Cas5t
MLGLYVTVPVACWRKGLAREFLETEAIPPPATAYGFLLSLVGEEDRHRHVGCRVTAVLLNTPARCTVMRSIWRVKKRPLGSPGNSRPDYQQLLTGPSAEEPFVALVVWLDSAQESGPKEHLESRVRAALARPDSVSRMGGLSLGESTHLVDEVTDWCRMKDRPGLRGRTGLTFVLSPRGRMTLPVWVDHVGAARTQYVTGNLFDRPADQPPEPDAMPLISPGEFAART